MTNIVTRMLQAFWGRPAPSDLVHRVSLPRQGARVRILDRICVDTSDLLVTKKNLDARLPGITGRYIGHIAGHGGDAWWIRHDGGTVGAYWSYEVELLPASQSAPPRSEP